MFHYARLLWVALLLSSTMLSACGVERGSGDGDGDGGDSSEEGATCSVGDDCDNIPCLCDDGSALGMPVNTQHCTNGRCDTPSEACPDSCATFGYSWTGYVVED